MFVTLALAMVAVTAVTFYRVVVGPTLFDRMLAASVIGTTNIAIIAVVGFIYERPDMFVDLAIAYAMLNFISTVAIARYLESQGRRE
jgi:multicomponent Na+:H+ antiporter subunit F